MNRTEARLAAAGAGWSMLGNLTAQLLGLVTTIAVARAVEPEAYGVVGMASALVAFAATVRDLGFAPAVAAGRMEGEHTLSTAHWFLCAVGAVCTCATVALAPAAGSFFGSERVTEVLRVSSLSLFTGAAATIPQAILQRRGHFRSLALVGVLSQLAWTGVAFWMLRQSAGVWTLVVPGFVASAVSVPLSWIAVRWLPLLTFDFSRLRPFLKEGAHLSTFSVLNYFSRNADNAFIGRFHGEAELGRYAFAYGLLMRPLGIISHSFTTALLPTFGRLASAREQLSSAAVRAVVAALRLGAPLMVGGALTCHLFIPLVFGDQWRAAVPLVQIFMITGALQIVGPLFGAASLARGESRFIARWGLWTSVATVLVFWLSALLGDALTVALAYLGYTLALIVTMYLVARRHFQLPLAGLTGRLLRVGRDVGMLTLAVLLAESVLGHFSAAMSTRLAACVLLGGAAYVLSFRLLDADEMHALVDTLPVPLRRLLGRLLVLPTAQ